MYTAHSESAPQSGFLLQFATPFGTQDLTLNRLLDMRKYHNAELFKKVDERGRLCLHGQQVCDWWETLKKCYFVAKKQRKKSLP